FEMHPNLRQISRKTLPSPYVERNSRPTPVLNLKLYAGIGLDCGVGVHTRLLSIARYRLPVNQAGTILPSNGESCDLLDTHRPNGSKYLHLLFAHRIGIKRYRRLHRSQRQQLKEMVRHHIPQSTRLFVEGRAVFDSDRFSRSDFYKIDV